MNEDDVVWSRERITASDHGRVEPISGADQFVFGHTPLHLPLQFANQHYIDTGAVFTGNLTLLQIQGGDTQNASEIVASHCHLLKYSPY